MGAHVGVNRQTRSVLPFRGPVVPTHVGVIVCMLLPLYLSDDALRIERSMPLKQMIQTADPGEAEHPGDLMV